MRPRLVAALVTAVGGLGAACAAPGPDDAPTPTAPLGPAGVYRNVGTVSLAGGEMGSGGLTDAVAPDGCDDSQGWVVAQRR